MVGVRAKLTFISFCLLFSEPFPKRCSNKKLTKLSRCDSQAHSKMQLTSSVLWDATTSTRMRTYSKNQAYPIQSTAGIGRRYWCLYFPDGSYTSSLKHNFLVWNLLHPASIANFRGSVQVVVESWSWMLVSIQLCPRGFN